MSRGINGKCGKTWSQLEPINQPKMHLGHRQGVAFAQGEIHTLAATQITPFFRLIPKNRLLLSKKLLIIWIEHSFTPLLYGHCEFVS